MNEHEGNGTSMDGTQYHAGEVVKAAMAWRWGLSSNPTLTAHEWKLYDALTAYGDKWKGVRSE